jgi:hypothetical protein
MRCFAATRADSPICRQAFLNLTDEPAEVIVVYTPGGGHKFYEELGPLTRDGTPDRSAVAAVFEKYGMNLLGPPLTAD